MTDTVRSLLVHQDASPRSVARLELARNLGLQLEASVTALYGTLPSFVELPFVCEDQTGNLMPMLQEMDDERAKTARLRFDDANTRQSMRWMELASDQLAYEVAREALYADLLVLGQYEPDARRVSGVPPDFVTSVLIESGKPALVVPYAGRFESVGRDVLVAWKATRESARALTAAVPLLRGARTVHVADGSDESTRPEGAPTLASWLALHGVDAKVERHRFEPAEDVGEDVLNLCADVQADLLVMGCYGHSRAREFVLGGVSRTVLRSMTVPVLMSH